MAGHFAPANEWLLLRLRLSIAAAAFVVVARGGRWRRRFDGDGEDRRERGSGDIERRREGFPASEAEEEQLQRVGVMDRNPATLSRLRSQGRVSGSFENISNLG